MAVVSETLTWSSCCLFLAIATVAGIILWRWSRPADPYGSFHLQLNILPHERHPSTQWLNMGYWKDTKLFPRACEALALKVIIAAKPVSGGAVLDVGHASGDSLLLYLSHPSIPRPSVLHGITSIPEHHTTSLNRIKISSKQISTATDVQLTCSDAIYHDTAKDIDIHPLNPENSTRPYTSITAIDCIYHFNTRQTFLTQSYSRLAPQGHIALSDIICISPNLPIPGIPRHNITSTSTLSSYTKLFEEIGYVDVTLEDITEDVFPPFCEFLSGRGVLWWVFAKVVFWGLYKTGTKFVVVSARKPE